MEQHYSKSNNPIVTVLMSVYNGKLYLREAIESILGQTFSNFEFLIVDDCSKDESLAIINSYQDSRIRIIRNEVNLGLGGSLNKGLAESRGFYIIRMDDDDISAPERIRKQILFMEKNPQIGASGSGIRIIRDRHFEEVWCHPTNFDEIKCKLLFYNVLFHPSVIIRKSILKDTGICYNSHFKYAQDYDLWARLAEKTSLANMGDDLLYYRVHSGQVSIEHWREQEKVKEIVQKNQLWKLGIQPTEQEFAVHCILGNREIPSSQALREGTEAWLLKLKSRNDSLGYYPEPMFTKLIDGYLNQCR